MQGKQDLLLPLDRMVRRSEADPKTQRKDMEDLRSSTHSNVYPTRISDQANLHRLRQGYRDTDTGRGLKKHETG